jgi:hypothetical protein
MFKLRFDDKNYQDMIDGILEFDKKLFPSLAKKMRFNYNSIR